MKCIAEYDKVTNSISIGGNYVGACPPGIVPKEIDEKPDGKNTVELVKLGVPPDDIIKLKNNDLL